MTHARGAWYPDMPPMLAGETTREYSDRITDAMIGPYDHHRSHQCAIGFHVECAHPRKWNCECPHHNDVAVASYDEVDSIAVHHLSRYLNVPNLTARRVLAHAQVALKSGEASTLSELRIVIEDIYNSPIGERFALDVVSVLNYRERNGKLTKK